ncbi:MAG: hypothetical protein ACR2GQ_02880 [Gemmatimonadota bacterium]
MSNSRVRTAFPLWIVAAVLFVAACGDTPPTDPGADDVGTVPSGEIESVPVQDLAQVFRGASAEVLALPQTVYADHDEAAGRMVFGVEHRGAARGIENAMKRRGIPASAYEVKVTEPILFMATLRDRFRPTMGGVQIHFGNFLCTLGFNVDHAGGRSFITNSHCTDQQGTTSGTTYFQPLSSVDSNPIAVEVDDPSYFRRGACPKGKQCRYSDASRALYQDGVANLGEIARTTGVNNGSLEVAGTFDITAQDNSSNTFSGTLNKVGRTTGWTQGNVSATCVDVNVSGSNLTLLCQTIVTGNGTLVGGGDSGSAVFRTTTSNTATLVGILWGGSSSGDLFVFSPLSAINQELGAVTATTDGVGGVGGGGGGGGGGDEPNCPPKSNKPGCR